MADIYGTFLREQETAKSIKKAVEVKRKEWVGLTDEDIYAIQYTNRPFMFARAIEAKLKAKNAC